MAAKASADRRRRGKTDLDYATGQIRSSLLVLAIFSLAINLLMLTSPIYMLQVYDRVLVSGRVETLVMLTVLAAAALFVLGVLDSLRSAVMVRMSCWLNDRLGPVLISSGVRARLVGDSAGAQPLRDLAQVQSFLSSQGLTALFDAPWTPVCLALIWLLHPALGIFATGAALLLALLGLLNELMTRQGSHTASTTQIAAFQQADSMIRNAEVVRAMGMLPGLLERWRKSNDSSLEATRSSAERGAAILGITKFLRFFVQSATLGLGAYLVLQGEVSGGTMIASSILLGRALAPVELAMGSWRSFLAARIAYDRLKSRLQAIPAEPQRTRLPEPLGNISLKNVSYSAPGAKGQVLDNVSFRVTPGEALAVIGPSASGKSTLCRLIAGIAAPSGGEIRLDGSELHHWNPEQLGRHVGYLPQDVELFSGSIRDNISRMARAGDDEVVQAAMLAHAHEMIQRLPQGYETPIGDAGARLSGGQRQRIGLARAVFGNPKIIILDEPNANLDQSGETALAAAVRALKERGAALMIVGHRPSTLAQADKILFLRDGRVEVFGTREDVLGKLRLAGGESKRQELQLRDSSAAPPRAMEIGE
ncbi:type I secretion system permease/ATPase [Rhizobium sp. P32RR-XVIII]|uniref:type I secretion system permease/ATPase n=1 Tax=Rhizobium sp. P32RR-XVIII TaxID=2726738 RepID=UPI001456348C|nr:type I secretion system permease/ATPase [Rhizobium sp. P32RR-XVIII]NLS05291.1 type I secretion system permease/ATPase [Rhizobium sp. P32RR-XVIII]